MNPLYAPQRRLLLSMQQEESGSEPGLIRVPEQPADADSGRQTALSVPESIRSLGEPLDPFFDACGGRQVLSVAVRRTEDGTPISTYLFQQPFVLIGRCTESDLALRHATVGFRHLYLQLVSGRWSYVNLARLAKVASTHSEHTSGWFDPGDELSIGPYTIRHVVAESGRLVPPASDAAGPTIVSSPVVQLDLLNGRSELQHRRSRQLTQPITLIGSGKNCDLWLRDDSVSTTHASLVRTPRGIWVVDLLGRNGVWIDDRPAYWKQIHDGSELQIGRFRMRVKFVSEQGGPLPEMPANPPEKSTVGRQRSRRRSRGGSLSENAMLALVRQLAEMQNQFFEHSQLQMQMMTEMLAHLGRGQQDLVRRDLSRIDDIGRELKDLQSQLTQPARKQRSKPRSTARRPAASKPGSTSQDELASADASLSPASSTAPDRMAIDPPPALETPPIEAPALDAPALDAPELESPALEAPAPLIEADETVPESRIPAPSPEFQPPATECDTDSDPPGAESSGQPTEEPGEPDSLDAHARLTRRMARLAQERNNRWRRVLQAFKRKP